VVKLSKKNTKKTILNAAKSVFARKGFDASSLDEIAKEAGIKKALIFYYFPSKESLFLAAWNEGIDELENHIFSEIEGEGSFIKKFKQLLKSYIDFVMSKKDIMKLLEMDKVKILENEDSNHEGWYSLKDRYNSFIYRIEILIDEGKTANYIPKSVPTQTTARMIAESMGLGAFDEKISLEQIVQFIMAGMSL